MQQAGPNLLLHHERPGAISWGGYILLSMGLGGWFHRLWWLITILLDWYILPCPKNIFCSEQCSAWICLCHEPLRVGPQEPKILTTTTWTWQGTDFFLGSAMRVRACVYKITRHHNNGKLDPDGCLVADQISIWTHEIWKIGRRKRVECSGAQQRKFTLQKKEMHLRWRSVFSWPGPFNGCHNVQFSKSVGYNH